MNSLFLKFPFIRPIFLTWLGALLLTGCTGVQVTPQTRGTFQLGELQVITERNFATTYEAVKAGMKNAGLFQTSDEVKTIEAVVGGRDSADARVVVKVKEVGRNRTSVKIRYGVPGDLVQAQALYREIEKRL